MNLEYFKLSARGSSEVQPPVDIHNEPINVGYNGRMWQRAKHKSNVPATHVEDTCDPNPDKVRRAIVRCDNIRRLQDCIYCPISSCLIVSERAAELILQYRTPAGTSFIPVDVQRKNGDVVGSMVAVMFLNEVEAVDLSASKYTTYGNGIPWYFTEPVVKAHAVNGLDLLSTDYVPYLCSDRLKTAIEAAKLSNFGFQPVGVSN